MSNIFKKLESSARNIYKKADSTASNFFKKLPSITNRAIDYFDNVTGGLDNVSKKVGNFLEKNSQPIANVASSVLNTAGYYPASTFVSNLGNYGKNLGTRLKNGNDIQHVRNQVRDKIGMF
jgi:hypothetical protein